jgi:UPF0176 protein
MHKVILYYYFHPIEEPGRFRDDHRCRCEQLKLSGRVYIAREGLNGTLAGTEDCILTYKDFLRSLPGFERTEFKEDVCEENPFRKLIVKTRPEIVTLKAHERIDPSRGTGPRLMPDEWRRRLESGGDYVLLDTRNHYEWAIGHFEGALLPEIENFYDFPRWVDAAGLDKDKMILMYCTGGIRCEKAALLMERRGYKNVFQLHGGIIHYGQKEGGAHFKGKCFVFDDRLAVPINRNDPGPISRCLITGIPCDRYVNCVNPDCNRLFICSKEGARQMSGCCSAQCLRSPRKRPFDSQDVYARNKIDVPGN